MDVERHSDLLFVHHNIRYFKHGGQVIFQIDHAAVSAREGHKGDIVQCGQLFEDAADCRPGQSPADSQFSVGNKRTAGAVAEIVPDYRCRRLKPRGPE